MNALNHRIDLAPKSGALRSFALVVVGVLLLAALADLSMQSGGAALSVSSSGAAPPVLPAIAVSPSDTGVPDAATVFRGRVDEAPEEAPPTF